MIFVIENFFELYKLSKSASSAERYKIFCNLKKLYFKLNRENQNILMTQKLYVAGKIMTDEIVPIISSAEKYKSNQKILRIKGRSKRSHRTHQLISIGSIWRDFLFDNCLYKYMYNVNFFDKVLKTIKNVNVAEELILDFTDDVLLPSPYNGRNKKVIHHYCQIGGTWEAYWRAICKNDKNDKTMYLSQKKYKADQILDIISNNKPVDNYPICNELKCKKIGLIKSRCLKLDEKFFYLFLRQHKNEIIDAIVHP